MEKQEPPLLQPRDSFISVHISHQILAIQIICIICFLFVTMYLQFLCMWVNVCGMSGIEAPLIFQQTILGFYFFTLIFLHQVYTAVVEVKPDYVICIKWPLLLYAIIMIIFAVVAFIRSANYSTNDVQSQWNSLSALSQSYFSDSSNGSAQPNINILLSVNEYNLILIGVYHVITGLLLVVLFFVLFNYQYTMPLVWRPVLTMRNSCADTLIYRDGGVKYFKKSKLSAVELSKRDKAKEEEELIKESPKNIFQRPSSRFTNRQQPAIPEQIEPPDSKFSNRQQPVIPEQIESPDREDTKIQPPNISNNPAVGVQKAINNNSALVEQKPF